MRESVENDERMRKMCGLHQPVPMDRLDLLPAPLTNTSGIYTRQLKNPKILQRPVTASAMVNAVSTLSGRNIEADYLRASNKTPAPIRIPRYVKNDLDVFAQQTYQGLNSFPNISNILYTAVGTQQGVALPSSIYSYLSTSVPSVVSVDSGYMPFQPVTPSSSVDTPSVDSGYAPYVEPKLDESDESDEPEMPVTPGVTPREAAAAAAIGRAPPPPPRRISAQELATREALIDPEIASRALFTPDRLVLRSRAVDRTPSTNN